MDWLSVISAIGGGLQSAINPFMTSQTNKNNLKIARETNAFNAEQNELNRALAMRFQEMEQAYNSPVNQRSMLESAGYSPYSLFDGGGSSVGGSSVPSSIPAQSAQMIAPQVDIAGPFAALMQGLKSSEERNSVAIQNEYLGKLMALQVKQLGLENQSAEVSLEVQQQTKDLQVLHQKLMTDRLNFENELAYMYQQEMTATQLQSLNAEIELAQERKRTEISQQGLNKILGKTKLNEVQIQGLQLKINQYLAKYQAQVYQATTKLQNAQSEYQGILNDLGRRYGVYDKLLDLANKWQNVGNTYQKSKLTQQLTQELTIKNKYLSKQQIADIVVKATQALNNLSTTLLNFKSLFSSDSSEGLQALPFIITPESMIPSIPSVPAVLP